FDTEPQMDADETQMIAKAGELEVGTYLCFICVHLWPLQASIRAIGAGIKDSSGRIPDGVRVAFIESLGDVLLDSIEIVNHGVVPDNFAVVDEAAEQRFQLRHARRSNTDVSIVTNEETDTRSKFLGCFQRFCQPDIDCAKKGNCGDWTIAWCLALLALQHSRARL